MEQDEYADIEWSEAGMEKEEEESSTQETASTLIQCARREESVTSSKQSPYTKEDRLQAIRMHKTHLLILLSSFFRLNELASDPLVIGCCLSVVPRDCLLSEEDIQGPVEDWKEKCRRLVLFCSHFVGKEKVSHWEEDYGNYVFWQPFHIQQWLESPRPLACIFAVFVCAIFRGLGMRCRLIQSLIPFPKQPWWTRQKLLQNTPMSISDGHQSSKNLLHISDSSDDCWWLLLFAPWMIMSSSLHGSLHSKETFHSLEESLPCIYWLEVYSPTLQRWVHIDPFHILIDEPSWVELSYKKWKLHPFRQRTIYPVYITAIENVKDSTQHSDEELTIVRDVTLRYISLSIIRNQRLKDDTFWEKTMEAFCNHSTCHFIQSDICIASEEREWEYWNNKEPIPNSTQKLKGHPKYVLEMHLKKYEAIYPRDRIVGYCGEYPVYPRSSVHILHTRDGWIREMRQVIKDQVAWKRVKTRGKKRNVGEEEQETELFGIWQTEPFIPGSAENGIVPKNERGQVDLWSRNHLPQGCVHVKHSNAGKIAKRLGLDYAPAMVGFDIHQGRSVPVFDGIVVAKEYQEILEDACRQDWQRKESEQIKQRYEQALSLWKACIRHIQSHLKVKQKYGGLLQDDLSYEKGLKKKARISSQYHHSATSTNSETTTFHIHEFSKEQPCQEEETLTSNHPLWYQQCSSCGLRITFEKIQHIPKSE